jgi:hypothetical protein
MATKSGGRPSIWTSEGGRIRTPLGHTLVLRINELCKAHGWASNDRGAVRSVIAKIRAEPPYSGHTDEQLRQGFYAASKALPPPAEPRDQLISSLQKLGAPFEASRALVDRLIPIVTINIPFLGLPYIDLMFDHVRRARRLRTALSKVEWLERAADKLESNRPSYPIRPWDQASNVSIELIKTALRDGLSSVDEIAAHTRIKRRTAQELLAFMASNGDAVRKRHGLYGPPQESAAAYVRPGEATLKILERGPASPAEIRERAGLTKAQVAGAVHWLWKKAGKIKRLRPNLYALPGAAPVPHVYARDAIINALRSGRKSVPELITITGKNRGEIWAALRRLRADGIIEQVGFRNGHAVRPGFRGRVAVFALTPKGRRRDRRSRQPQACDSAHVSL